MSNIGSDSSFRDSFILGAAKAFFCCAYADYVEEGNNDDNDLTGEDRERRAMLPRPGAGGDWMNCLPELPPNAYALAGELWVLTQMLNKKSVYQLADLALNADCDPTNECESKVELTDENFDAEKFGHYLAMQALGHGVSWFDNHAHFDLKVPHMDCEANFDPEAFHA